LYLGELLIHLVMLNIVVREARVEDLPTLLIFEQGIISSERPYDETLISEHFHYYDLAARIQDTNTAVVVAEANGKVVGSGSAIIKKGNSYNSFKEFAFLGFMYVDLAYRGNGVNKVIIEKLIEWANEKGLKEIRLQVYDDNTPAVRAYEKVGFKKILTEMRLVK
jgi:GNAT superfamily N-acetyltransferase